MCCSCFCNCLQAFLSNCCKCLGKTAMACCRGMCRCFCNAVSPGCGFLCQIILYALFQGFNIGTDVGVFFETSKTYQRCDELSTATLVPLSNTTNITRPYCVATKNATQAMIGEKASTLQILEGTFFFFMCLSGGVYVIHIVVLFPNTCKHLKDENFENMVTEAGPYYQKILQIHTLFLLLETLIHDVPMSCLAVELCAQMWGAGGINCWECAIKPSDLPPNPMGLINCEKWLGLMLGSIALVSVYKGILPLYAWIGNPFCWACYPLRICVVLPAGLLYCVLTLAPAMGVAINRLFVVAPQMKTEMGTISSTIWTFGMFFWGIIVLVSVLYKYFCGKWICGVCCPCESKEGEGKSGCLC
ncbi:hypothetical protein P5673_027293 [Acropora cervicornis]|uniref:Uncharacterized protein n=1 Tax=Acropora cervicornis TaxID=6130 RepID=A0AAD9PZ60_ACRCE|nr:hypothetical protein P5673_027293 [Acropora cervicornis]